MAEFRLQLDKGLTDAEALRDVLKENLRGEIVSVRYSARSGIANVTTRAFPAFPEIEPESDASKLLNEAMDNIGILRAVNEQDRIALDKREANALLRERALDDRDAKLVTSEKQREGELKELERLRKELRKGDKTTFIGGLRSIFHRIK